MSWDDYGPNASFGTKAGVQHYVYELSGLATLHFPRVIVCGANGQVAFAFPARSNRLYFVPTFSG
jgi:hypothetical protein